MFMCAILFSYISSNIKEVSAYLKDIYGVYPIRDLKKEKVTIRVSKLATHYFLAYPLHESQKITKENHGSSFITFELIPSDELARYFLAQGKDIEILQPAWFKKRTQQLI